MLLTLMINVQISVAVVTLRKMTVILFDGDPAAREPIRMARCCDACAANAPATEDCKLVVRAVTPVDVEISFPLAPVLTGDHVPAVSQFPVTVASWLAISV